MTEINIRVHEDGTRLEVNEDATVIELAYGLVNLARLITEENRTIIVPSLLSIIENYTDSYYEMLTVLDDMKEMVIRGMM